MNPFKSDNMDRIISFCNGKTSASIKTLLLWTCCRSCWVMNHIQYLGSYRNSWSIIYGSVGKNSLSFGIDQVKILCIVFQSTGSAVFRLQHYGYTISSHEAEVLLWVWEAWHWEALSAAANICYHGFDALVLLALNLSDLAKKEVFLIRFSWWLVRQLWWDTLRSIVLILHLQQSLRMFLLPYTCSPLQQNIFFLLKKCPYQWNIPL